MVNGKSSDDIYSDGDYGKGRRKYHHLLITQKRIYDQSDLSEDIREISGYIGSILRHYMKREVDNDSAHNRKSRSRASHKSHDNRDNIGNM